MEVVDIFKYKIFIGENILNDLSEIIDLKNYSKVIVIADSKIPENILSDYERIVIPSGEENKNIETVQTIWKELLDRKADRKTLVINLGGGVIGDMGGFAAATYMRGINFLQIPTTLLSAVDASVGGKLGIDFSGIKNIIGSFNQPIGVIIDTKTFDTLPEREFISGFGEIIKHGIIANLNYYKKVTAKPPRNFSSEELIDIIKESVSIKSHIVSGDEKESGKRKLLNFGHTIGHAIESFSLVTDTPLLHGEAVSIGMVAEAKISEQMGLITENEVVKIRSAIENAGLPVTYQVTDKEQVISLLARDKKSEGGKINWTLIKKIGEAVIDQDVSPEHVLVALEYIS